MAVRVADKIKQMNDAKFFLMDADDIEIGGESLSEKVAEMDESSNDHASKKDNPHSVTKSQVGLGNVTNDKQATKTEFDSHTGNKSNPHGVTKTQVGLGNADNTADADKNVLSATKLTTARKINGVSFDGTKDITIADDTKIPTTQKGAANGVAELDENGLIPSSQLPGYVDDTIEGTLSTFPKTGESGKIYVDTDTNLTYRWSGSGYVEISKSIALGETSSTAYPGNKGKQNATDIASLKTRMTAAENDKANKTDVETSLGTKVDKTTYEAEIAKKVNITDYESGMAEKVDKTTYAAEMEKKADLVDGIVPDNQLPYYNDSPALYAGDVPLYGTTFADVDDDGNIVIKEDGSGDYLLTITILGVVLARYIGNEVTDNVTGQKYSFTISNGIVELKEII